MNDTETVEMTAARDAAAMVASAYRNDPESLEILSGYYTTPEQMAALCGALLAFSVAVVKCIDGIGEEIVTVHGVPFPSSQQVLSTVLARLAENN